MSGDFYTVGIVDKVVVVDIVDRTRRSYEPHDVGIVRFRRSLAVGIAYIAASKSTVISIAIRIDSPSIIGRTIRVRRNFFVSILFSGLRI